MTSILGLRTKEGVILAGDQQVTQGNLIVGKQTKKIIPFFNFCLIAGTGTVEDIQYVMNVSKDFLEPRMKLANLRPTIKQISDLLSQIIYIRRNQNPETFSCAFIVAGFDEDGSTELFSSSGCSLRGEDYCADGSGSLVNLGIIESGYKSNMSLKKGLSLVKKSLKTSGKLDVFSNENLDIYTITKEEIKKLK
jgi:proteasome beta subunit